MMFDSLGPGVRDRTIMCLRPLLPKKAPPCVSAFCVLDPMFNNMVGPAFGHGLDGKQASKGV